MKLRACARKGHDWFPPPMHKPPTVMNSRCMRCRTPYHLLPWGYCISGHPLAEHYDAATEHYDAATGRRKG